MSPFLEDAQNTCRNNGTKITHTYFTEEEFIEYRDGSYYFEDGVKVPHDWWDKEYLLSGWSEFKPKD